MDPTVGLARRVTTTTFCFFQWLFCCCFFILENLLFLIPQNCFSWESIGPALIDSLLRESRLFLLRSITILRSCYLLARFYVLISRCVFLGSNILNHIFVFIFCDILIIIFLLLYSLDSKSIVVIWSTIILFGRNLLQSRLLLNLDSRLVRVLKLFIACLVFVLSRSTRVNL